MANRRRVSLAILWAALELCAAAAALGADLDARPLKLRIENAFPAVAWQGWQPVTEEGLRSELRPILLTHAGDHSGRVFVPTQQGVIYVLPDRRDARDARVFLDIRDQVTYDAEKFEEGFLGLAFHPRYSENGQFFVYYTNRHQPHQNVIARFRVSDTDPDRSERASEKILLTLDKPFWNHDGGTVIFGPDGYLYIAVGDGGKANDPFGNGQSLKTLLGKVLRIDVDRTSGRLPYAIPADNPFVRWGGARREIWAYGLRNVWRMAFDRETGTLWAADVGQDLWEEIDLITCGGNYGWNVREGHHPFRLTRAGTTKKPIEPIWEYHHSVGKSITGGMVYRGRKIPELVGGYLYADYVAGKMWALFYDAATRKVTANREIPLPRSIPVMSFGEDEGGEAFFMTSSGTGEAVFGIYPAEE